MAINFRKLYIIPWIIFGILNIFFLGIVFIIRWIGKSVVFVNNHISATGDWFGEQADTTIEDLLSKVEKQKELRKIRRSKK